MNNNNYQIKLLTINEIATICFIITTAISLYITENEKRKLENNSYKELGNLELYNRLFVICLLFIFLYLNYEGYKIAKVKGNKLNGYKLQLISSVIVIIAGFITIYASLYNKGLINIENPEI